MKNTYFTMIKKLGSDAYDVVLMTKKGRLIEKICSCSSYAKAEYLVNVLECLDNLR